MGVREVEGQAEPASQPAGRQWRVRAPGGGRKKLSETDPQLSALVDPETRGDPMSLLVWTTRSTKNLAGALTELGHPVSDRTMARMLRAQAFSLQATRLPYTLSEPQLHEAVLALARTYNAVAGDGLRAADLPAATAVARTALRWPGW